MNKFKGIIDEQELSNFKSDYQILKENFKFIWDKNEKPENTWEEIFAKNYYDKLYKEYCIADLSKYKEGKIGLRWCTENDILTGKGIRVCGSTSCQKGNELQPYEVTMNYSEEEQKKIALVKVYLCTKCARKLNKSYKYLKRKRKRDNKKKSKEIKKDK